MDNTAETGDGFKIENIDEGAYKNLLNKIFANKTEERDLAMDRYRKADTLMGEDGANYLAHGRTTVEYLALAAEITNSLVMISKDIKSIVWKNTDNAGAKAGAGGMSDKDAEKIARILEKDTKSGKLD